MMNEKNQIPENIFKIVNPKAIAAAAGVLGVMGRIKAHSEDNPKGDPTPTPSPTPCPQSDFTCATHSVDDIRPPSPWTCENLGINDGCVIEANDLIPECSPNRPPEHPDQAPDDRCCAGTGIVGASDNVDHVYCTTCDAARGEISWCGTFLTEDNDAHPAPPPPTPTPTPTPSPTPSPTPTPNDPKK